MTTCSILSAEKEKWKPSPLAPDTPWNVDYLVSLSLVSNPKGRCRVHKSQPLGPILSRFGPVNAPSPYVLSAHFSIFLPPTPGCLDVVFSLHVFRLKFHINLWEDDGTLAKHTTFSSPFSLCHSLGHKNDIRKPCRRTVKIRAVSG